MGAVNMTLWDLIENMEGRMPLTARGVDAVLGVRSRVVEASSTTVLWEVPDRVAVGAGLSVTNIRFMLHPERGWGERGALSMEVQGGCITLAQLRQRHDRLELRQSPRGQSLQETAVWAVDRPWGQLTFAFQMVQPDCLFRVGFHKQLT